MEVIIAEAIRGIGSTDTTQDRANIRLIKDNGARIKTKKVVMIQFQSLDVFVPLTPVTASPDSRKFGY